MEDGPKSPSVFSATQGNNQAFLYGEEKLCHTANSSAQETSPCQLQLQNAQRVGKRIQTIKSGETQMQASEIPP